MKSRSRMKGIAHVNPVHFWGGRGASLFLLGLSFFLLLFSAVRPDVLEGPRVRAMDLFTPVLSMVSLPFQAVAEFAGDVSGVSELRAENAMLEQENARLREWYQTALILQAENKSLQELLNVKLDPGRSYITARVIADAGNTYVKSFLVAAGSADGVKKGQAVLSGEGMIGRIVEVGNRSSRILLLTDFNSRIPVLIEGTRQRAVLAGTNEDRPVLLHLPPDSHLEDGARIITSGHGGVFPSGLPVGRVTATDEESFVIRPFADMHRITYVRIVDHPVDPNLRRGVLGDGN